MKPNLALCISAWLLLFGLPAWGQDAAFAEEYRQFARWQARREYEPALTLGLRLSERPGAYAELFPRLVQVAKALDRLDALQRFFEAKVAAAPAHSKAQYGLGLIWRERRDWLAAARAFEACLQAEPEFAPALAAWVELVDGQHAEVEALLKARLSQHPAAAQTQLGWGLLYARQKDYPKALEAFDEALRLNPALAAACYQRANLLKNRSRIAESVAGLGQCLPLIRAGLNEEQRKDFWQVEAINYARMENKPAALAALEQLKAYAAAMEDVWVEHFRLATLANIYQQQGQYSAAIAAYTAALQIARQNPTPEYLQSVNRLLVQLGRTWFFMGDFEQAESFYRAGARAAEQSRDTANQALIAVYLGDLLAARHQPAEAARAYQEAVTLRAAGGSTASQNLVYVTLASMYLKQGDWPRAEAALARALQIGRAGALSEIELGALAGLGELQLRKGAPQAALQTYAELLQTTQRRGKALYEWLAHYGQGLAYQQLGQLEPARQQYQEAVRLIESARARINAAEDRTGFLQDKVAVYQQLLGALFAPGAPDTQPKLLAEAFQVAESARARALLDMLAEVRVEPEQLDAAAARQQAELQQRLTQLNTQLHLARETPRASQDVRLIEQLETRLAQTDQELAAWWRVHERRYADLKYPAPLTLAQTQAALLPGQVMLAYALGESASYLFAVSRQQAHAWKLAPAQVLGEQAGQLLAALTNEHSEAGAWQAAAESLYQVLIQPAAQFLQTQPGVRELIVVPDGALHRVPFEVLLEPGKPPGNDARQLPYLVKRYALSYAPSATVLKSLKEDRANVPKTQKAFLAFADPQYDRAAAEKQPAALALLRAAGNEQWKFERLSNSAREARGIASVFAKGEADLYLQEGAREENVKLPDDRLRGYRIVHFSAHGLLNERRPRFSGLVLTLPKLTSEGNAPEGGEDGILSAYEIFNLKLNAELVTLSACETGLGKEVKGEGLLSLVRAFMYAGTPSVLASLWKVDDAGTADLMIDFYRFWQHGRKVGQRTVQLSKAEALRQAQLKAIEAGSPPFYWAPFVLVGRSD